jgi:hypothetical protein
MANGCSSILFAAVLLLEKAPPILMLRIVEYSGKGANKLGF